MANTVTTRARDAFSSNREKLDFAEQIALLDPNQNPFTLIGLKLGTKTSGNIKHSWLYDELVSETDTMGSTAAASTDTAITVSNGTYFAVGDIVRINGTNETVLVTGRSTNTLTITRDYGYTAGAYTQLADTIAAGAYLTILSNAFEEGHELPVPKSTTEVEMVNYCQDVRTPFAITEVAAAAAVHGEQDWPFQMKKAGITHQRKLDWNYIFGHPEPGDKGLSSSGTGNANPATAGGIVHFLTGGTGFDGTGSDRIVEQAEITQTEFLDFLEPAFEYGSAEKVMFTPPMLRTALDYWGISKLQTFSEKNVFGMNVAKWVSAHGTIVFVTHKMLKDPGSDGAIALLLDMDDISIINYSNIGSTRLRTLEPYKATGQTVRKAEYQTISSLELRTPKKHAMLTGMTSYAA